MFEWDDGKAQANLAKHGVAFTDIGGFDWHSAEVILDVRLDYGEARWIALGLIGDRVHVVIYTERGLRRRLISLRKANEREKQRWLTNNA